MSKKVYKKASQMQILLRLCNMIAFINGRWHALTSEVRLPSILSGFRMYTDANRS